MVNALIQGPIQLGGAGYAAKLKRNYQPGEYRRLSNVELVDNAIVSRRNISACNNPGTTLNPLTNSFPFVGFLGDHTVVASATEQRTTNGLNGYETTWAPTSLPVDAAAGSYHKIVGVYRYNDFDCWITEKYNGSTGLHSIYLYRKATNYLASPSATVFADLTATLLFTDTSFNFVYCNFFIQGERLWVVTSTRVHFSKATEHTVFAAPDGGFFDFQGQTFNFGLFLKDTIYILCDNAIFSFTYNTDPNTDASSRQLSHVVGGDHGCVHRDTPYFVNATGIYTINNSSITKVMDNKFDVGNSVYKSKITSWEQYLIVNKYEDINYDSEGSTQQYWYNLGRKFSPGASFNLMGYNVFFINTNTGATHVLDFKDSLDTAEKGYICDVIVNPHKNFYRDYSLLFMTNKFISLEGSAYTYSSHIYKMGSEIQPPLVFDSACNSAGLVNRHKPAVDIEIDSYAPDGNEYFVKKFRSVEIMGYVPSTDFEVRFGYDNQDFPASGIPLLHSNADVEAAGDPRAHHPMRVGLNQRAKSLSIRFNSTNNNVSYDGNYNYDHVQISDIRVLWTYTQRGISTKTVTMTT